MKLTKLKDIKYRTDMPVKAYEVAVEDWDNVPRCTIQRNEALRVLKAHLRILKLSHWSVFMAVFPDGTKMKIDGHTRGRGWTDGSLSKPPYLSVTVFSVESLEDAEETYQHHDSKSSVKSSQDSIQSAMNKLGIEPKSEFVAAGAFSNGLGIAVKFLGLKIKPKQKMEVVETFADQIRMLDELGPKKDDFTSGVAGAFFASTYRLGKDALPFWKNYTMNCYRDENGNRDATGWAVNMVGKFRDLKLMTGAKNNEELAGIILSCVNRHRAGNELLKNTPITITAAEYCEVKVAGRKRPANDNLQLAA